MADGFVLQDGLTRHSPLESFAPVFSSFGPRIRIIERPFRTMIDVRLPAPDHAWSYRDLPAPGPLTAAGGPDRGVLWLGPAWWLVVERTAAPSDVVSSVKATLGLQDNGAGHGSVVDVSAWRTIVDICGPRALSLLETGCATDFHPTVFGPGACVQTLVAQTPVILQALPDDLVDPALRPVYRLFVRASYAFHLAHWILDATDGLDD